MAQTHTKAHTHTLTESRKTRGGKGQSNKQSVAMTKLNPKQRTIKTLKAATLTHVHEMPLEMTRLNINKNTKWRKHATHRAHRAAAAAAAAEKETSVAHMRYMN